tara:strand:+ start:334 stop:1746 length:1413 start_codon:yes stop_codon:yes gene_type:complete
MTSIATILNSKSKHTKILSLAGNLGDELNMGTYVVGGYVRDLLLNKETNDIDIMVEGDAIKFANDLASKLKVDTVVEFPEFQTALIPYSDIEIEIASARRESYREKSRKPIVETCTIDEDLSRRDFTVNAMAASLMKKNYGELNDPHGGIRDLQRKILITPLEPEATFKDDPLRILRGVRFSAQLNFEIASNVKDAMMSQKKHLDFISQERITQEIIKILKTNKPSIGLNLLREIDLYPYVFPEIDELGGVEIIDGKGHKDVFYHTLEVVDNAARLTSKMKIRFAALVHDIAKPRTKRFDKKKGWTYYGHEEVGQHMVRKIAKRMKLSNELRDYLMILTKLHLRPIALAKEGVSDSAIRRLLFEAKENADDLMILCRADITTKNKSKVKQYLKNFDKVESLMRDVKLRDEMRNFKSPITGEIIMKEFNIKPGREVGKIKSAIENAILDGLIENNYDDAFTYMMKVKKQLS